MAKGLRVINQNLAAEIRRIKGRTVDGMQDAGEAVLDAAHPVTPIRTGDLRKSRFVSTDGHRVVFGYTDKKAPLVHEQRRRYRVGFAKWFEVTLSQNERTALDKIFQKARFR